MKPQINKLNTPGEEYIIRTSSGDVYKTIGGKVEGKYVWNTSFVTSSPKYVLDGVMLSRIPNHIKRLFFKLQNKIETK